MATTTLGVVMPCFNEREWVSRSVDALSAAARRAGWPLEILIVDDGSTDPRTIEILDSLTASGEVTLLRQENAGRLAARSAGLDAIGTDYVLLLDSRVIVHPDALAVLKKSVDEDPGSVWNAHVDVVTKDNPWAAFWGGLTKIGWRAYFAHPRRLTFGVDDFDRFPKGTGAFACPVAVLRRAASGFDSLYRDTRFASDDTKLLRNVAAESRIGIDPGFSVDYHGRDSGRRWAAQVLFRGTTFVDGYVKSPARATALLAAAGVALPLLAWGVIKWPAAALGAAATASVAAAGAARACGGTRDETVWTGVLLVPFGAIFGTGLLRGLVMAAEATLRHRAA